MKILKEKRILGIIFCLALIIRLVFVLTLPLQAPDAVDYDRYALHILNGLGFSTDLNRAPLYPTFLAAIYLVFGHSFLAVRIIQSILGAITCLLVYFIGERIFKNKKAAILGAGTAIISPSLVASNSYILTETLTTFLLTIAVVLLMKALASKKRQDWIAGGIFLGLSTLTRPITFLFPFFLLLALLLFFKKRLQNFIFVLIFSLAMAGTILPWTIRNYFVFKEFIPITTGGGSNLWIGSYLPWNGDYNYKDLSDMDELTKGLSLIERDKKLLEEARKNIKKNPGTYSLLCLKKLGRFWLQIPGGKRVLEGKNLEKALIFTFHYIVLLFFFLGIFFSLKERNKEVFIPLLMIFYFTVIHSLLFAIPRYRISIMPLVLAIAGGGLEKIVHSSKRRSWIATSSATESMANSSQ